MIHYVAINGDYLDINHQISSYYSLDIQELNYQNYLYPLKLSRFVRYYFYDNNNNIIERIKAAYSTTEKVLFISGAFEYKSCKFYLIYILKVINGREIYFRIVWSSKPKHIKKIRLKYSFNFMEKFITTDIRTYTFQYVDDDVRVDLRMYDRTMPCLLF